MYARKPVGDDYVAAATPWRERERRVLIAGCVEARSVGPCQGWLLTRCRVLSQPTPC